jgi:hypothetical protein
MGHTNNSSDLGVDDMYLHGGAYARADRMLGVGFDEELSHGCRDEFQIR